MTSNLRDLILNYGGMEIDMKNKIPQEVIIM